MTVRGVALAALGLAGCYLSHTLGEGTFDRGETDAAVCESREVRLDAGAPFAVQTGPIERTPIYGGEGFGDAIAWSTDGRRIAIGSFQDWVDEDGARTVPFGRTSQLSGAVTVLDATTPCVTPLAYLLPTEPHDCHLGLDVAISDDGRTVAASAFHTFIEGDTTITTPNVVYVFRDSGSGYLRTQRISVDDSARRFGDAIALRGGVLFVGDAGLHTVSAYVDVGGTFEAAGVYHGDGDWFGASVDASADGSSVVVGAADPLGGEVDLLAFSAAGGFHLDRAFTLADVPARAGLGLRVAMSDLGDVVAVASLERSRHFGLSPLVTILRRTSTGPWSAQSLGGGDGPIHWGDWLAVDHAGTHVAWVSALSADFHDATLTVAELRAGMFVEGSPFVPAPGGIPSPCGAPSRASAVAFGDGGRVALGAEALCAMDVDGTLELSGRVFVLR